MQTEPKAEPNRRNLQRSISIAPDVNAMLERIGNASEYISASVRQRWQRWSRALGELRQAGWENNEILAACEALNGSVHFEQLAVWAPRVARELVDWHKTEQAAKWKLARAHEERIEKLGENAMLATALVVVVAEFWSGNDALLISLGQKRGA
jgi:hypothetical protein